LERDEGRHLVGGVFLASDHRNVEHVEHGVTELMEHDAHEPADHHLRVAELGRLALLGADALDRLDELVAEDDAPFCRLVKGVNEPAFGGHHGEIMGQAQRGQELAQLLQKLELLEPIRDRKVLQALWRDVGERDLAVAQIRRGLGNGGLEQQGRAQERKHQRRATQHRPDHRTSPAGSHCMDRTLTSSSGSTNGMTRRLNALRTC
jgi:hypothetical protein